MWRKSQARRLHELAFMSITEEQRPVPAVETMFYESPLKQLAKWKNMKPSSAH